MFCYSGPELKAHVQLRKASKQFQTHGIHKVKNPKIRHDLEYLGMEILQWLTLESEVPALQLVHSEHPGTAHRCSSPSCLWLVRRMEMFRFNNYVRKGFM